MLEPLGTFILLLILAGIAKWDEYKGETNYWD